MGIRLELSAPLERPLTVNGTIVAADGAKLPDLSPVAVRVSPASGMLIMNLGAPVKADAAGKFQLQALSVEPHRLTVNGVGPGFYVQEVRYNGVRVADNIVALNSSALAQELTIVLDDKPALITGAVLKNGRPVSRPVLVLARWPLPSGEDSPRSPLASGDEKGRFQIGGLAPGEYRLMALAREALSTTAEPDAALQRALASAQKIELGAKAIQDVTIELTELR